MRELYRWFLFTLLILLGIPLLLASVPLIMIAILIERTGFWGDYG